MRCFRGFLLWKFQSVGILQTFLWTYRLERKSNSLLKILSLVIKYVILKLIEVVVQGDGFCRRGSRMSEKNYETSELKELKDALQTFTEFVWEMEEYLPEFYHFLMR